MTTLDKLKIGQTATVESFQDDFLALKLTEMGCIPGEKIKLTNIAPLGDPIAIEVAGYFLSMRKQEASVVVVTPN